MWLQMNEPAKALEQFELTLQKEPRRFRALYGAAHAAQLSGDRETSQKYFRELVKVSARADSPGRPEIIEARQAISQ
jgi:Tfp pilus assembly protein PilF